MIQNYIDKTIAIRMMASRRSWQGTTSRIYLFTGHSMNSGKWFYLEKGQSVGPKAEAELAQLLGNKVIALDTLIWSEGMGSWSPLAQVFPALSVQPRACPEFCV
jgi:hypothetical protein